MSETPDSRPASPVSGCADQSGAVHYGGQAVIEGVMMRGPDRVATAVRLPDGTITVQTSQFVSASKRSRLLRSPVVRGGLTLIESLALGIRALNYSASVAMEAAEGKPAAGDAAGDAAAGPAPRGKSGDWKTSLALSGTMVLAFALGILVFFYVPLVIAGRLNIESGILFNLVDGVIRVVFFIAYIWGISLWKEMRRVFEYHGAEHKAIFTQEAGQPLTVENARRFTTRHPRCGTSFLLIVMVVSILVFMLTGKPHSIAQRLARILLVPVIAGISYEIMKLSAKKAARAWARVISAPGVWLQRITTREPSDEQLEVAIAALSAVLAGKDDARQTAVDQGQA
ncbi:MAG: DUF1385 domain-containing protein [Candidatus Eisenbacteria bacterium]|nr:DUF1385 domain-containing protein [Candidatus Eisenbacteria bacterium]